METVGHMVIILLSCWLMYLFIYHFRTDHLPAPRSLQQQQDQPQSGKDDTHNPITAADTTKRSLQNRNTDVRLKVPPQDSRRRQGPQSEKCSDSTVSATHWSGSDAKGATLSTNPTSIFSTTHKGSDLHDLEIATTASRADTDDTNAGSSRLHASRIQPSKDNAESSIYTQQWLNDQGLQAQIYQKDQEITRLKVRLAAIQEHNAGHLNVPGASEDSVAQNDRESIGEIDSPDHQQRFLETFTTYETNIKHLENSHAEELQVCRMAYTNSKQQLELQVSKTLDQDSKIRDLQDSLSDTELKRAANQLVNSDLHKRLEEEERKAVSLATQLQGTKVTVEEYHNRLWPLIDQSSNMKAEIAGNTITIKQRDREIFDLTKKWEDHQQEHTELLAKVIVIGKLRDEAVTISESWRMKYEDLKNGQDRAVMYSDVEGDLSMIDAPGLGFKVDIPWVMQVGEENIKLRLEMEHLTKRLNESELGAMGAGSEAKAKADYYLLRLEATASELKLVKKEHDDVVREHQSVMQDIKLDPLNHYHPIYKKIDDLRARVKEGQAEVARLEEQLLEARAMSWDRRTSMVECHSPKW